jgi:hypothetical protein
MNEILLREATFRGYRPDSDAQTRPHPRRPSITMFRFVETVPGSHGWSIVWGGHDQNRNRCCFLPEDKMN